MRPALTRCTGQRPLLLDFLIPRAAYQGSKSRSSVRYKHGGETKLSAKPTPSQAVSGPKFKVTKPKPRPPRQNTLADAATLVRQLHDAAREGEVLTVWKIHEALQHNNKWLALGAQNYGFISRMIVSGFRTVQRHSFRTGEETEAVEELAFACAAAGNTDGLRQMMIWHLGRGEVDTVVRIFERFERDILSVEEPRSALSSEAEPGSSEDLDGRDLQFENPDVSSTAITNILVIALAAYAQQDSFEKALHIALRYPYRPSYSYVLLLEKHLRACEGVVNPKDSAKLKAFSNIVSTARIVRSPGVFKRHLRNVAEGKGKDVSNKLEKLVDLVFEGFDGPLPWAARTEDEVSATRPVVVEEKIWAYIIHTLLVARCEELAQDVWVRILKLGYTPSITIWNALLEGYRDTHQLSKLRNAWRVMRSQGIEPDAVSYTALIGVHFAQRMRAGALQTFEEYRKVGKGREDALLVYNTVINGYLSERDLAGAKKVLDTMKQDGVDPDIVTHNIFIKYHARRADMAGIAESVQRLLADGLEPDVFTYTTILNGMFNARITNATDQLLTLMTKMGVKASVATYSTLIDTQVREGTGPSILSAWRLLDELERQKDVQPNIITYTSVLTGIHRSRDLEKEDVLKMSRDIVRRIRERGLRLRLGTYHILLKTALENPMPEGITCFKQYYDMLVKDGIPFWHDTWYIILNGLVRREKWELASKMKGDMLRSQFEPMWGVLDMVKIITNWEKEQLGKRGRI